MEISVSNRQRGFAVDLRALRRFARAVLPLCLAHSGASPAVLPGLEEVGVVLVSDKRIAALHEQFLHQPGPTDVITFAHGEIVIGCGVAHTQATEHRQSLTHELCRYIVHGLLHLNGHEDHEPAAAARMWRVQERVVRQILKNLLA